MIFLKGRGRGWYDDRPRHREAALKGHMRFRDGERSDFESGLKNKEFEKLVDLLFREESDNVDTKEHDDLEALLYQATTDEKRRAEGLVQEMREVQRKPELAGRRMTVCKDCDAAWFEDEAGQRFAAFHQKVRGHQLEHGQMRFRNGRKPDILEDVEAPFEGMRLPAEEREVFKVRQLTRQIIADRKAKDERLGHALSIIAEDIATEQIAKRRKDIQAVAESAALSGQEFGELVELTIDRHRPGIFSTERAYRYQDLMLKATKEEKMKASEVARQVLKEEIKRGA